MHPIHRIVIGTSAGGLTPLKELLGNLPKNFPASIFIVKHIPQTQSLLLNILNRNTKIPVVEPTHCQSIEPGIIYVAPPGMHMTLTPDKIELNPGPHVNRSRPAIDPLFYSAALTAGSATIGILLSGLLDDGTAGMIAIKKCGGTTIIQDPEEAEYPDMPKNAWNTGSIDYCLPTDEINTLIKKLVHEPIPQHKISQKTLNLLKLELDMNKAPNDDERLLREIAQPSSFSCPTCQGVLWKVDDDSNERYRCRVGHAFGLGSLQAGYNQSTEQALWAALRCLEEKEKLEKNITRQAKEENSEYLKHFEKRAKETGKHIDILKKLLTHSSSPDLEESTL